MSKRLNLVIALLMVASLVLAACTGGGATEGGNENESGGGAAAPKLIKIATQSPLSGGQSLLGVDIKNGAQLAVEQLSGPLTEMGFTVELAPYDDQATPDVGVANAKAIVADPAILCGVGHLNSGVMIPSSEEYHAAGLAFVSPANTNPVVTTRGYKEVNRIVGRDDVQAPVAEAYAFNELGAKSVYIIHDKTAYGQGVAEFFRKAAEKDGMAVLGFEGTEETANFDAIITPLLAANPDVVFFSGIYNQAGVFFKQARDAGYEGTFMGTDGMDASGLADLAGDALVKGGGMVYTSVAGPASAYPKAAQFAKDFEAKFGAPPQPFAAQGYDAAAVCLKAIENAAKAANGEIPTRAAVADAIRALTLEGITGTISFDSIGDLPKAKYFIIKVNATTGAEWNKNEIVAELEFASPGMGE
ncbi:MAG: branched-chain amino acid ABC transporter substrate-binding protein [Chloroflexota bacterium]